MLKFLAKHKAGQDDRNQYHNINKNVFQILIYIMINVYIITYKIIKKILNYCTVLLHDISFR